MPSLRVWMSGSRLWKSALMPGSYLWKSALMPSLREWGRITARNVGYEVCADQMDCRAWHRTNRSAVYPEAPSHWRVIYRFFYSSGVSHSRAGRLFASSPCSKLSSSPTIQIYGYRPYPIKKGSRCIFFKGWEGNVFDRFRPFSTFRAAERVARKFLSQGFTRQDISVFFTTPPGQHAQYPIGGDQYADPGAQLAARGAASWMSAGAIIGALAGTALYFILWRYWLIPIACLSVGAYIGSLIGALRRMREQTARSAHHGQDTGVMLAVHVAEENAVNAVQLLEKSGAADIEKATGIGEEDTMPYQNLEELPDSIKKHLPAHAQHIYKAAFNQAWDEYQDAARRRDDASREETAHKVAWSAVKNQYEKNNETGQWKSKKSF